MDIQERVESLCWRLRSDSAFQNSAGVPQIDRILAEVAKHFGIANEGVGKDGENYFLYTRQRAATIVYVNYRFRYMGAI